MAKKQSAEVEWVGGVISMPAYVTGDGEPYRPEALVWLGAEGAVLGSTVAKPGEVHAQASESLKSTIAHPMVGQAHAPARVRVASEELAAVLRAGHPAIEVLCAPTPEVNEVAAAMRERIGENAELEQSYLAPDISPEMVGSFFRSAAGLFRTKPWELVPGDGSVFSVTIEKLNLREAALSIIGQLGQHFGFVLFSGIDDFEAFTDASDAMADGEEPNMPPHFVLHFDRGEEVPAVLRQEVAEHRWELASENAYPWLVSVDEDLVVRPATAEEVTISEAISLALPKVLAKQKALHAAWNGGELVSRTVKVHTYAGDFEVTLRVPYEQVVLHPPFDVIADLYELARDSEELDPDARAPLEDELLRQFGACPEAKGLSALGACQWVMDFAADYFGATIATLEPTDLREIVFDIIPRKVSIPASAARGIIDELRAFYAFMKREFGFKQADACLRVLAGDAAKKLEAAMSNTGNFGMAKSLFMGGAQAGFDMSSQKGIDAWMREMSSKPLPASIQLPPLGAPGRADPTAARAKKKQRKAARKARKRNK